MRFLKRNAILILVFLLRFFGVSVIVTLLIFKIATQHKSAISFNYSSTAMMFISTKSSSLVGEEKTIHCLINTVKHSKWILSINEEKTPVFFLPLNLLLN